jgi:hypothetical protein
VYSAIPTHHIHSPSPHLLAIPKTKKPAIILLITGYVLLKKPF